MKEVKSSAASHIGYDPETGQMHVTFKSGKTYTYEGVTPGQHALVLSAPSVGKTLHKMASEFKVKEKK